ncbi:UbiH/UbiF family hydroxylase [Cupriavidus plantarum]|uniref:2-octaprenyl-3-methyl-6-methoxy-1,4-benzoquinol hydroxylase n=3 Tax=Cupriavidus plantarum TaxID=942865 RepID=A0A316ENV5_9BURK|nr:UbiH/UbiF family hydroxylase [Cupriavidus plantarum]NYI02913.1 ubiquinone biosynthesis UbiH/UbiF/VisC/COQ6 family hydroxylase [Cupriavidus plantarum]PWK32367.1 2-octaprenyl-3-methyl-6-methoxy-1,4-benzoquinol hydroxylase [Cupriavidus plantarum]REE87201.1 2-octaprenyl-3-methyl-6-methoxy-1,4-benzoquinol hydroxylase [Cupriavidus plantarum]RLK29587.1 2-octaprenyl-3-methyl-6-methoxy-1,4-benzoquinol hydroxylase [Cupriavidus plantarum]CAG2152681.1 3-demethoxyubiquinol 3-hydroxylase [Cupriavidus pla
MSSTSSSRFQIAVVGGGIVGKACALLLAQQGMQVALIAPRPASDTARTGEDDWDSRIYAFSASSQALLERLRVWEALDPARMQPVRDMRVFGDQSAAESDPTPHGDLHFSSYAAAVPQLAWIIESGHVERTLDTALRFQHQVQWFDDTGEVFERDCDGVTLTLASGARVRAACVVGADGARSWVRQQSHICTTTRRYRQLGVVANFRCELPHHDTAWQWFLGTPEKLMADEEAENGEILAMLPLPGNRVSMVWSAEEAHARELVALSPEALAATVMQAAAGAVGARFGTLRCITPAQGFPLVLQRAEQFVQPHVALVGDAAHVIHPLAGQGMNLGLRDVTELGRVMADKEAFRGEGDLRLLRRYERARATDLLSLTAATDGLHRLFSLPGSPARVMRNLGIRAVGRQSMLKQFLIGRALG